METLTIMFEEFMVVHKVVFYGILSIIVFLIIFSISQVIATTITNGFMKFFKRIK